jgi:hypothetical protein
MVNRQSSMANGQWSINNCLPDLGRKNGVEMLQVVGFA